MILFGFKGCGKTYFGKKLAEELKRPFVDTDDKVVELYAAECREILSIRAIYQKVGEPAFRELERRVLSGLSGGVIALGGGTLVDVKNVALVQKIGRLIYLEASFEALEKRVFAQGVPAFVGSASLRKVYEERIALYQRIPAVRVSVDAPEAEILALLKEHAHGL